MTAKSWHRWHRLAGCVLAVLLLAGCKVDLYSHLSEQEANEMVAILLRHNIDAGRTVDKDKTLSVQVEQARFADAIELLKEAGYPQPHFASMGEVFAGDKMVSTPIEERARLMYALSQELSRTVSEIDGVYSARVHLVLPANDPLRQNLTPSSASVFVRYDKSAPIEALTPQIKMLVANGIEGLTYDKVSVIFVPVERRFSGAAADPAANLSSVAGMWVLTSSASQLRFLIYGLLSLAVAGLGATALLLSPWRKPLAQWWSGARAKVRLPVPARKSTASS